MQNKDDTADLIRRANAGDESARSVLLESIYPELRKIAGALFRDERSGHTLQPTALVHEAYMKLSQNVPRFLNRKHLKALLVRRMRQLLTDYARERMAAKRDVRMKVPLEKAESVESSATEAEEIRFYEILDEFGAADPDAADVFDLHYLGGMTFEEVAEVIGISLRTAKTRWANAKASLEKRFAEEGWS